MRSRYSPTRASFRPANITPIHSDEALGLEVYAWEQGTSAYLMAFAGQRARPDLNFRYALNERAMSARAQRVAQYVADVRERAARKQAARAAKRAWAHGVQVGDVFRASWGYEQTNIDYYEVTGLIGRTMVEVREIEQQRQETGFMSGDCVPLPGSYKTAPDYTQEMVGGAYPRRPAPALRLRVMRGYDGEPYLAVSDCARAYLRRPQEVAPGVKVFAPDHWTAYA